MPTPDVRIGTSGWVYPHWKGTFYPEDLPLARRLSYYSERFATVEVNNTYYRLASEKALRSWLDTVPAGFRFAFKAHQYITHRRRLRDAEEPLRRFQDALRPIEARTDVVLFQLPPFLPFDPERLDAFLGLLPRDKPYRHVFEFRNPTWHNEQTFEILSLHDVGFCIHDFGEQTPLRATSRDVYVRLHGPAGPYRGRYTLEDLALWAGRARGWLGEGKRVLFYFNNDQAGYAPHNALELRALVEGPDALPEAARAELAGEA